MNAATLRHLKWTYTTRILPHGLGMSLCEQCRPPRPGDLVVGRVLEVGAAGHVEDRAGRRVRLHAGDHLIGALGNRYASGLCEGYVLDTPQLDLLSTSGLIGRMVAAHEEDDEPTGLEIVGGLADDSGRQLSVDDFARPMPPVPEVRPATVAIVGTGPGTGKTRTGAALVRGWTDAGMCAGAGRVNGSVCGADHWDYVDAGANAVLDMLDFGMPSTFGHAVERLAATVVAIRDSLGGAGCEAVVLETADGLLMPETASLLPRLVGQVDAVVLTAGDAVSAKAGAEILRRMGLPLRALSGLVSRSPIAAREAYRATGLRVLSLADLEADGGAALLQSAA